MAFVVLLLAINPFPLVLATSPNVNQEELLSLSLLIETGGDATKDLEPEIGLSLDVGSTLNDGFSEEEIGLSLFIGFEGSTNRFESIGLSLDFAVGSEVDNWRVLWLWDPYDPIKFTGKNYTYEASVSKNGIEQEAHLFISFEGFLLTEKDSNSTGQFEFWAIVNSPGWHIWTISIYQNATWQVTIYKDEQYQAGEPPGPEEPEPPDLPGDLPDTPQEGIAFTMTFFPWLIVLGLFGFMGKQILGNIGILLGCIAGLIVLTMMGEVPMYLLMALVLVTLLIIVYKLKKPSVQSGFAAGEGA